jgi:hypothetical protein
MAPGGGSGGQQFAMPPPGNSTPSLPGTSLPEQGIGVGTEGGRPPGSTGPPGGTAQAMTPVGGGSGY